MFRVKSPIKSESAEKTQIAATIKFDSFYLVLSLISNSDLICFIISCVLNFLFLTNNHLHLFQQPSRRLFITPSAQLSCLLLFFCVYLYRRRTLLKLIRAALPRKGRQHVKIRLALLKVSLFIHLTPAEASGLRKDRLLFAYELTSRFSSHRARSVPNLKRQLCCLSAKRIDFSTKPFYSAVKTITF